jgi:hypothetical protein
MKSKYRRAVLLVLLVGVGFMMLLYVWLAFWPTGYERLQARQEEAVRKTEAAMRPVFRTQEAVIPSTTTLAVSSPASRPGAQGESPLNQVREDNVFTQIRNLDRDWAGWLPLVHAACDEAFPAILGLGHLVWDMEDFPGGLTSVTATAEPIQEQVFARARDILMARQYGSAFFWPGTDGSSTKTHQFSNPQEAVDAYLDHVEQILLAREWRLPPREGGGEEYPYWIPFSFQRVVWLTVRRAAARRQEEKVANLVERALEIMRLSHFGDLGTGAQFRFAEGSLFHLCESGRLSDRAIHRAQEALARAHLTPAQLAEFRLVRGRTILGNIEARAANKNAWHSFGGGVPEAFVQGAFRPIWKRQARAYATAYAEGDAERLYQVLIGMRLTGAVMNYDVEEGGIPYFDDPAVDAPRVNTEADLTQLALAAARYKREHGAYPQAVSDLRPAYLDGSFFDDTGCVWVIQTLPSFEYPDAFGLPSTHPLVLAVQKHSRKRLRDAEWWVEKPEALRQFARDDAEYAEFKARFKRSPETLVLCRFCTWTIPRQLWTPATHGVEVQIRIPGGEIAGQGKRRDWFYP